VHSTAFLGSREEKRKKTGIDKMGENERNIDHIVKSESKSGGIPHYYYYYLVKY
jgi:hypothetical protein|tara:strand:+ start:376 stop:537 length:162 start_codon:yes stop_codon:yes gene_type:complete